MEEDKTIILGVDKTIILRPGGVEADGIERTRILRPSSLDEGRIDEEPQEKQIQKVQKVQSISEAKLEVLRKVAGIDDGGEKTRLVMRGSEPEKQDYIDVSDNPITAWLVITKGSGKGIALSVGEYENTVGRGVESRVQINYGDLTISNARAFTIYYDPSSRSFNLLNGSSQNPIHVNGDLLGDPVFLNRGDLIEVGQTAFRFIPFCDSSFDWSTLK